MFWKILFILTCITLVVLFISFIGTVVFSIGYVVGGRSEIGHPKIYNVFERCLTGSLLALLFTIIPYGIHECAEDLKEEKVYKVVIDDDIKITDENGKTYTLIFEE